MSGGSSSFVAMLALEMRAPLARIELLASQLRRETATPRALGLAAAISEAVGELDRLIDRSLEVLVPPSASVPEEDLGPVIRALRARVAPALAARGLRWPSAASDAAPVPGDPDRARAAAIHLLRAVAATSPGTGTLRVLPLGDGPRYGVEVRLEPAPPRGRSKGVLEEAESFALSEGGLLESAMEGPGWRLSLWLPRRSDA